MTNGGRINDSMGSLYKFMDKDGIVKWGEISIAYNPNNPKLDENNLPMVPVVIDDGYPDAGKLRYIKLSEILESR